MNVLALDIASTTGWAKDFSTFYGTWDFKTRKDESIGMKLIRFRSKLEEVHKLMELDLIVYERPAGRHTNSIIHQSKLIAVLEEFCETKGIDYKAYSATEIKKHATGKGNSGKPAMIAAAAEKFGYSGNDDNVADALHLLDLCLTELNIK
jgi:Holliday junction resolvasome RuvABC endonuclease subunit